MSSDHDDIDWNLTTWEGSRREQLRRWRKLSLQERFRVLEEMADVAQMFVGMRKRGKFRDLSRASSLQGDVISGRVVQEEGGRYVPPAKKPSTPDK